MEQQPGHPALPLQPAQEKLLLFLVVPLGRDHVFSLLSLQKTRSILAQPAFDFKEKLPLPEGYKLTPGRGMGYDDSSKPGRGQGGTTMEISFLWSNDLINVSVIAWLSAQLLKTLVDAIRRRKFDRKRLAGAGGMPSSHSAVCCAVLLSSYYLYGFNSSAFALSFVLALIVMYDATGVRWAAGLHAKAINQIVEYLDSGDVNDQEKDLSDLIPSSTSHWATGSSRSSAGRCWGSSSPSSPTLSVRGASSPPEKPLPPPGQLPLPRLFFCPAALRFPPPCGRIICFNLGPGGAASHPRPGPLHSRLPTP